MASPAPLVPAQTFRGARPADEEITLPSPLEDVARMVGVPFPRPEPGRLGTFLWDRREYLRVRYQLRELPRIGHGRRPTFVFAHILAPHQPKNLDARGRWIPLSRRKRGAMRTPSSYFPRNS